MHTGQGRCEPRGQAHVCTCPPPDAILARASPLSPKVPEMDGCSPVNFLGVFCFLPDSGERKQGPRFWSNNHREAWASRPLLPPQPLAPRSRLTVLCALRSLLRGGHRAGGPRCLLAPQGPASQRKGAAAGVCAQLEGRGVARGGRPILPVLRPCLLWQDGTRIQAVRSPAGSRQVRGRRAHF